MTSCAVCLINCLCTPTIQVCPPSHAVLQERERGREKSSEVGHVPLDVRTIERRCGVMVFSETVTRKSFLGPDSGNNTIPSSVSCTNKRNVRDMQDR